MAKTYELDPAGDVLIILAPYNVKFAPWDDTGGTSDTQESPDRSGIEDIRPSDNPSAEDAPSDATPPPVETRFKVSSKHLTLASPRFEKMLTGDSVDSKPIYQDGLRHLHMNGIDPAALLILMDIIHGRSNRVPRELDVEMLAKIALLVHEFECENEVEFFSDAWVDEAIPEILRSYNRNLVLWILISYVFQKVNLFKLVTHWATIYSPGKFRTLGLPIVSIAASIDAKREDLLDRLVTCVGNVVNLLLEKKGRCNFSCDSTLAGALVKQLQPYDLPWPRHSERFSGFSFVDAFRIVSELKSPIVETHSSLKPNGQDTVSGQKRKRASEDNIAAANDTAPIVMPAAHHGCSLRTLLHPEIVRLKHNFKGLNYSIESLDGDVDDQA